MPKRIVLAAAVVILVGTGFTRPASSQTPWQPASADIETLKGQIHALAAAQLAIQKEIDEIRNLLQPGSGPRPAAALPVSPVDTIVETADAPAKGAATAKLTVVEFTDFECAFCGRHERDTLGLLEREYVQTGKVRYVVRNFPLGAIHPRAFKAGVASLCAAEQGKYWEMHDRLFANQAALVPTALQEYGRGLVLDMAKFGRCLDAEKPAQRIRQDMADGASAGVRSTPSFLIGLTIAGDSKIKAARLIRGAQPYAMFKAEFDSLLALNSHR
jgi:protein-disulfide isomerase